MIVEMPKVRFTGRCRPAMTEKGPGLHVQMAHSQPWTTIRQIGPWVIAKRRKMWTGFGIEMQARRSSFEIQFRDDGAAMAVRFADPEPGGWLTFTATGFAHNCGLLRSVPWRVLYVGISDKITNRWVGHTRIIEAQTMCREGYEIGLVAMKFQESVLWESEVLPRFLQTSNCIPREIEDRARLLAIEGVLIWHLQPLLNIQGRRTPAWQQARLSSELIKAGITDMSVVIEPENAPFSLFTESMRPATRVEALYKTAIT